MTRTTPAQQPRPVTRHAPDGTSAATEATGNPSTRDDATPATTGTRHLTLVPQPAAPTRRTLRPTIACLLAAGIDLPRTP